ncbi:MAG: chorismate-binding protein [Bernardetiaceae bacterium]|nr:chorismate-binding protein [Bernardetiaceae bacterium]
MLSVCDTVAIDLSAQLSRVVSNLCQAQRSFALWRMPENKYLYLVASFSSSPKHYDQADLEILPAGFLVAPFDVRKGVYFIPADEQYKWEMFPEKNTGQLVSANSIQLFEQQSSLLTPLQIDHFKGYLSPTTISVHTPESFQLIVSEAIRAIERHEFQKVVLSRQKCILLEKEFHPIDFFLRLTYRYPSAFVSLVAIPEVGVWIGASPELLVSVDKHQIFRTMALAGTKARNGLTNLQQATWTQKEIGEQAMVSRYIINCFKKIRLREFEEYGPRTVAAGELIHLRTDFEVDMRATNFPQLGTVMLSLLHPTSAVCGMPKEPAAAFIYQYEHYDRSLYSGYLGCVNIENESHLFVNLRCLQLQHNHVILYAGAGITEDSDPEKEWQETEMKCDTLLKVLRS